MSCLSPREDANLVDCPKLYSVDSDLEKMLLIRLDKRILRLKGKDMQADELFEFNNILMTINSVSDCLNNRNVAIRSMTRILTIFLRKKTSIHKSALNLNNPEMMHAGGIVIALLVSFVELFKLDTPSWMDDLYRDREAMFETTFAEVVAAVLDRIAIVLESIFGNVTNQDRAVESVEKRLDQRSGKADRIFRIRKGLKQRTLCHHVRAAWWRYIARVPVKRLTGNGGTELSGQDVLRSYSVRYFVPLHIPFNGGVFLDGIPQTTRGDVVLLRMVIDGHLQIHAHPFNAMIEEHNHLRASSDLLRRNPILFVRFDGAYLPLPKNARLLDGVSESMPSDQAGLFPYLHQQWETVGPDLSVVWATFPIQSQDSGYPLVMEVGFLLEGDDLPVGFGEGWLGGLGSTL
ncbi:hypothetical protein PQX77_017672 [Marasmius sp. AFHP31]|nr:hypothetical protein PQX77_017672 [Marasmius sp. AFHP31]